jgi:hypothetical protein
MANDPCQIYRTAIASLNSRIDSLEQRLQNLPPNVRPDALKAQLQALRAQLGPANQELQGCLRSQNLRVIGVETTQAIQYFDGLPQGSHYAPSNSVPLISGKLTLLRLYANTVPLNDQAPRANAVTGTITLTSSTAQVVLSPSNGPLSAFGSQDRGNLDDSLNFLVPPEFTHGHILMSAKVFDPGNASINDELHGGALDFEAVPLLPIHGILIHYAGPDFFDNPIDQTASAGQLMQDLIFTAKIYPIPGVTYTGCEVMDWTKKTAVKQNFYDLKDAVGSWRDMSASDDIYVGIIPTAANCGGPCGLGSDGSAIYFAGDDTGAAHEIGHALGRHHTQCAIHADGADDSYPQYAGLPQGSIGEFGVDVAATMITASRDSSVMNPLVFCDVMSYCTRWIGPYTYTGLLDSIHQEYGSNLVPLSASVWTFPQADFMHAVIRIHHRGRSESPEVRYAFTIRRKPPRRGSLSAPYSAETLETDGTVIGCHGSQYAAWPSECGCREGPGDRTSQPFSDISICIPWMDSIRHLRIVDEEGRIVGTVDVATKAPALTLLRTRRSGSKLYVSWQAKAPRNAQPHLRFAVRYTADGEHWRAVHVGLEQSKAVLDLEQLPGGDSCRVQVVAYAGLRTSVVETTSFAVPRKPRQAYIVAPSSELTIGVGDNVACVGGGFSPCFGSTSPLDGIWTTKKLGVFGRGQRAIAHALPVGHHELRLTVPDGQGRQAEARVFVNVVAQDNARS